MPDNDHDEVAAENQDAANLATQTEAADIAAQQKMLDDDPALKDRLANAEAMFILGEAIIDDKAKASIENDMRRYIFLAAQIKQAEAWVKDDKADKAEIEARLLDHFAENAIQRINIDGATLFLNRRIFAGAVKREGDADGEATARAIEVLRAEGYDYLVKEAFSTTALSAVMKEREVAGDELPASFENVISVFEKFTIGVRRS